jgi:hypothetical protein
MIIIVRVEVINFSDILMRKYVVSSTFVIGVALAIVAVVFSVAPSFGDPLLVLTGKKVNWDPNVCDCSNHPVDKAECKCLVKAPPIQE